MRVPSRKSRNIRKLVLAALLITTPVAWAADRSRVNEVGQGLMCICGCGQILTKCNHLNCPSSAPMLKELESHIDAGEMDDQIVQAFVAKYGKTVLSEPPASGFNLLAYILPFAALLIGGLIAVYVARAWKSAAPQEGPPLDTTAGGNDKYRKQIEDELNKFTPED